MSEFENRKCQLPNRRRIKLIEDQYLIDLVKDEEFIGEIETIGESEGTIIEKESIFDIIEKKVEYALENPLSNLDKANIILSRVTCITEAYKNFTLPTYENVTWSLYDPFEETVALVGNNIIFEKVKEDTIVKVIATAVYEGAEASKVFEIMIRRTNPNYTVEINNLEWFRVKDELSNSIITITSTDDSPLYLEVVNENPSIMEKTKSFDGGYLACVEFKERSEASIITGLGTIELKFKIKVYKDREKTNYIGEIADCIIYSYEIYKPEITEAEWIEGETLNSEVFRIISPSNENLYCKVVDVDQKLNVEITRNGGNLILVRATEKSTGISGEDGVTVVLSFKVEVYKNSTYYDEALVGSVKYTINYTYAPADPID